SALKLWDAVQVGDNSNAQAEQLQQTVQWQKPACGWYKYKCNVNAGFHHKLGNTSVGCGV
ncbi:hypothetical protein A2U01_0026170, partial [Trifolium medium]|nr:hypothetical protein [Trifolium medium]